MRKTILARAILLGSAASFIAIPAQAQTAEETTQQAADQPSAPEATAAADDEGRDTAAEAITVTGRRAALQAADDRKRRSDSIINSVVADEAGKLPDNSITEVLQRVSGVSIVRYVWNVDNGGPPIDTGNNSSFTLTGGYPAATTHIVTLTITDNYGRTSQSAPSTIAIP